MTRQPQADHPTTETLTAFALPEAPLHNCAPVQFQKCSRHPGEHRQSMQFLGRQRFDS